MQVIGGSGVLLSDGILTKNGLIQLTKQDKTTRTALSITKMVGKIYSLDHCEEEKDCKGSACSVIKKLSDFFLEELSTVLFY